MKNLKKKVICTVLSLTLLIGSSMPSMAASGTVSYSKYSIKYNTSTTRVCMSTRNCSDANYQLYATSCCMNKSGTICYKWELYGGNGIWRSDICNLDEGPRSGCYFSNDIKKWNRAEFRRANSPIGPFTTLTSFSYRIG